MNKLLFTLKNSNTVKFPLRKLKKITNFRNKNNDLFTLWINDNNELPELQQLSLKSMLLTGHNVTLYTYSKMNNIPEGVNSVAAGKIIDKSRIFKYKTGFNKGSYSGFANWFRAKCLYENGGTWFDCDILAIKNINEIIEGNIISSQYDREGNLNPNNGFLKLEKKDKLLKAMIKHMDKAKDNVKHGDTGPALLKFMMDNEYKEYYKYLSKPSFIASINFFDYKDFLKPSKDITKKWNLMRYGDSMYGMLCFDIIK